MTMIDTWAATGAGAFTLTENGLYTVEGWNHFMDRLAPDGVFTVSRWYAPGDLNETARLISLASAVLLDRGIADPARHLFLANSGQVAALTLKLTPFEPGEVAVLRDVCERLRYSVLLSPGNAPGSEILRHILDADSRGTLHEYTSRLAFDLSPPTDDRPFFFNLLRLDRPLAAIRVEHSDGGVIAGNLLATLTLLTILGVAILLVVLTIILPLRPAMLESGRALVTSGTFYFALIGLGFMFVEMSLLQRLSVFLGHPVYSLSVVLFSLILFTGGGSLAANSIRIERGTALLVSWAVLTCACLFLILALLPVLVSHFEAASLFTRSALSVVLIAPAGLLMGFAFPVGIRMVEAIDDRPTPWFWGINGAAGVLASVVAVVVSIAFGIKTSMILGAVCYLGLIPPGVALLRQRRAQGAPVVPGPTRSHDSAS
jgi:hypothetical protein